MLPPSRLTQLANDLIRRRPRRVLDYHTPLRATPWSQRLMSVVEYLGGWIGIMLLVAALSLAVLVFAPNEWAMRTRRGIMFISAILFAAFGKYREHKRSSDW